MLQRSSEHLLDQKTSSVGRYFPIRHLQWPLDYHKTLAMDGKMQGRLQSKLNPV